MKIFPLGGKNEQENRIQYWNGCLRNWVSVLEVIGSLNQKRRNDLASIYRRRKWNPLQCSCLENPRDRGAWWAASMGSQSWTRLKPLSSSSSVHSFMLGVGWCFSPGGSSPCTVFCCFCLSGSKGCDGLKAEAPFPLNREEQTVFGL